MNDGQESDTKISVHIVEVLPEELSEDISFSGKFKKLFTFSYLVRDINSSNPKIFFKKHFLDKLYINAIAVFVQAQLLEPLIYLKLLEKNILFMHAAGVSWEDKGCVFPAHGGTGKTTTALKMVANGFKLLGDDLLIVDVEKNRVTAYPRPFHLFTYNINSLENARIPLRISLIILTKNIIRKVLEIATQDEFLISTRVHASELYPGDIYAKEVPIKKIVFLKKQNQHQKTLFDSEVKIKETAEDIVDSADLNDSLFENITLTNEQQQNIHSLELQVVSKLLQHFKDIDYINTRSMDHDDWEKFTLNLKEELSG